jgi:hypothetical protein
VQRGLALSQRNLRLERLLLVGGDVAIHPVELLFILAMVAFVAWLVWVIVRWANQVRMGSTYQDRR